MSATNLFVNGLPHQADESILRQVFEPFGMIASAKKMRGKGFGFVQFADPGAAAAAVQSLNGSALDGAQLLVKFADRNVGDRAAQKAAVATGFGFGAPVASGPSDNVFVGGLPFEWTEAEVNALLGSCGTIVQSGVLKNKLTGRPKGIAMVRFADIGGATTAVQSLNGYVVEGTGRKLEVRFADSPEAKGAKQMAKSLGVGLGIGGRSRFSPYGTPARGIGAGGSMLGPIRGSALGGVGFGAKVKAPKRKDVLPEEGANLHVFGLDPNVTELTLYQSFSGYGAIQSARVLEGKGYGFVRFFNAQDAHSAMIALNGVQVGSKVWNVTVHRKKGE